jgi:hypothetical protein
MKHRSVVISAVFVMLMVVGPQAAQQFSALKEAAGNRLQAGIWNVFLSYHAQKIESPEQGQGATAEPACDTQMADASARPARQTKKNAVAALKHEASAPRRESTDAEELNPALEFVVAANVKEFEGLERVGQDVLKELVLPVHAHDAPHAPVALSEARAEAAWALADERESVRRELRNAERDKETVRRLTKAAERAMRAKTAADEAKLLQLDVLKVINFDSFKEHESHLKARTTKVRPRVVLRAAKPAAPGTAIAPRPPASVVAC